MATQAKKLADSLEALTALLADGRRAVRSRDLTRTHRERLLAAGFLQEVMKGWYTPSQPSQPGGESTSWYISFWGFCADYLDARFGDDWCLSPEQSLAVHAGNWTVPSQLLVRSSRGDNNPVSLPFATSLFTVRTPLPSRSALVVKDGLRLYAPVTALMAVAADFFTNHEIDARTNLAQIRDASEVLPVLLEQGHTTIAGRLAGALENMGRVRMAEDIMQAMRAAGHEVRKNDPFKSATPTWRCVDPAAPHVQRLRLLWAGMRGPASACFAGTPVKKSDPAAYLMSVEETFTTDAYHSLSIEGYQVSRELIERIRDGRWTPDGDEMDRNHQSALAAKGYWQAFQQVQKSLGRVFAGENPGVVAEEDHGTWYRALIGPEVTAGLKRPADLAGYRSGPVRIRLSRHLPPGSEAVRDLIPAYFDLLNAETDPAARAVLAHFVFVYIHPYPDGNGRIGRFLMNLMLAAGGYPWTVVPMDRRAAYMATLEQASVAGDIGPFARLLSGLAGGENCG